MPEAAPLEPSDPRSLGNYEVLGRLGAGGQGAVYLGRSRQSSDHVAIKLLHAQYAADPAARARFDREVTAARKVASFCTAQVLDVGSQDGQPYVVSEFIDGPSLHDVVALHGPRAPHDLERLAIGMVTALAAIHEAGIVHRDFKPNNVMLASDGPRVVDFGIARTVNSQESAVTATGMVVGTPGYLAPEQLTGAPLQPGVDIFAWGATMVFAATGQSPFEAETLPIIINRILNEDPDLSALQEPLRGLVARCLSKDPALRPPAHQLLLQLLGNAGVAPGPAPERENLLAQGTQLAAALQAPPVPPQAPAPQTYAPPPQYNAPPPIGYAASGYTPGPATPPPGPMTPPPMMAPPMTPPPMTPPPMAMHQGPMTPPPMTPPPMAMPQGPMTPPPMAIQAPPQRRSSNAPIIAGIGCGALVLVVVIIAVVAIVVNSGGGGGGTVTGGPTTYGYSTPTPAISSSRPGTFDLSFEGSWTGTIYDSSGHVGAEVNLYPLLGNGLVTYTLRDTKCYGDLSLVSNDGNKIVMRETINYNSDKCGDGYETLTVSGSTLQYEFRKNLSDATPSYTGNLTKS